MDEREPEDLVLIATSPSELEDAIALLHEHELQLVAVLIEARPPAGRHLSAA